MRHHAKVIGLVEDDPGFKPTYRDQRVNRGLYASDTLEPVVAELEAAGAMLVRLFDAIEAELLQRPVRYGHPNPYTCTHEAEHHLGDVAQNLKPFE